MFAGRRGARVNDTVRLERRGDVAVLWVEHPPVNAISHAVRAGLVEAVARANAEAGLRGLVLACAGRTFMAGADIREFGRPWAPPSLPEVVDALEASALPLVAAIHGTALGGGLEVALGCHYRVALADARLGFPEVKLGLIPGAQGTQRLPRLVALSDALTMVTSGEPVDAATALASGLADAVVARPADGTDAHAALLDAAVAFARGRADAGAPPRRLRTAPIRSADGAARAAALAACRERIARQLPGQEAPQAAVQAVEAALAHADGSEAGFARGVAEERRLFQARLASPQSGALRHVFFGEREVGKVPGLDPRASDRRDIREVGVVGAGTMGTGIALVLLDAGFDVVLSEREWPPLVRAFERIRGHYEGAVRKGRLSEAAALERVGRLRGEPDLDLLAGCDLVIEAVFEDPALKREVFRELDRRCRDGAILATNTSTLDVDGVAAVTRRPQDVLGLHFFSPANVMRLLEIVRATRTGDDVLGTALAFARRLGKIGVVAGNGYGFIGNRMFDPYLREMQLLLLEGAPPQRVDAALEAFGMRLGPCKVSDLAGIDVGYRIHSAMPERPRDPTWFALERAFHDAGRYGQKGGAGFYRYEPDSYVALPDPAAEAIVEATARGLGIARRDITDDEIVERCVLSLINEGARVLEAGIALGSVDIDIVYVHGYGFPAWRGGPMYYADALGAAAIVERLGALARRFPARAGDYRPAPLLARLAAEGGDFAALGRGRAGEGAA